MLEMCLIFLESDHRTGARGKNALGGAVNLAQTVPCVLSVHGRRSVGLVSAQPGWPTTSLIFTTAIAREGQQRVAMPAIDKIAFVFNLRLQ
jgi:hypothetical protein